MMWGPGLTLNLLLRCDASAVDAAIDVGLIDHVRSTIAYASDVCRAHRCLSDGRYDGYDVA